MCAIQKINFSVVECEECMLLAIWEQGDEGMDNVLITLLSSAAVFMYPCRITVFENSVSGTMIGDMIFGTEYSQIMRENTAYNTGRNFEETAAKAAAEKYERRIRQNCLLEVIDNALYYIPQPGDINKNAFDYDFYDSLFTYIEEAEKISDVTMICTERSQSLSSPIILDSAEVVLVIMPLSHKRFVEFLDKYHSIVGKSFFVFMQPYYISKEELKKVFANLNLSRNKIIVLPYTENLEIHIRKGKVVDYVRNNIACSRISAEYAFISKLKKTVQLILGNNPGGLSYRIQQMTSLLDKRDYCRNKYKRIVPDDGGPAAPSHHTGEAGTEETEHNARETRPGTAETEHNERER